MQFGDCRRAPLPFRGNPWALALVVTLSIGVVAGVSRTSHAAEKLGPKVNDRRRGFSVRILQDFSRIPTPPKNIKLLGRFLGKERAFGQAGFEIRRYPVPKLKKPTKDSKDKYGRAEQKPDKKKPRVDPWEHETFFKSLLALTKAMGWDGLTVESGKFIKVGKTQARIYEFDIRNTSFATCTIPAAEGGEYGLFYWAPKKTYAKDFRRVFRQSMRTFKAIEMTKPDHGALAELDPMAHERATKKESIKGIPGWWALDTDNYVILSNSDNRALVRYIGRSIERIRADVYTDLFPPVGQITALSVVRVCASRDEYMRYGGLPSSAGYWNSKEEELVFFDKFPNMSKKKSMRNSLAVLFHEAFHQYIFYAFGEIAPHSWFNEGHGDYFAGAEFSGRRVRIQPFQWRVPTVKLNEQQGRLVPLKKFAHYTKGEYYSNGGPNYAQGWAFIYFLRTVTRNERYRQILPIYFNTLKEAIDRIDQMKPKPTGTTGKEKDKPSGGTTKQPGGGEGEGPGGSSGDKLQKGDPPNDADPESAGAVAPPSIRKKRDPKLVKKALGEAVDKAFEGIDFERLDAEFHRFISRVL